MSDKLIRELLINVKQQGATKVTKMITQIEDGLENAAAGAELTNEQLNKLPKTLYSIERAADRASKSLMKVQAAKGVTAVTTSLTQLGLKLDGIAVAITSLTDTVQTGFTDMGASANQMANVIGRATERVADNVNDVNRNILRGSKGFSSLASSANTASRALGNTSGSARGATREFSAMAKVGGGLPILYAAIASNLFVLNSIFDNIKIGDQLTRLEKFGTIVGQQTGTPVQVLAQGLQEAVGYAISYEEAMKQASMAAAYGFSTEQLEQFGLVARRAAAVLGVDMTDALNRVIKGVSKQEIELLDELGVTIRLNDAYAVYVNQLNAANTGITYNANSLSSYQKQQAYANAVIAESTKRFGYLDDVLKATDWEAFGASANSALRNIQQAAAKYLEPTIASINSVISSSRASVSASSGRAQAATNRAIDSSNAGAVALGLASSEKGYSEALTMYREALKKKEEIQKQFDAEFNRATSGGQAAIRQVAQGVPVSIAAPFTSDANKETIVRIANMAHQLTALDKEIADSTQNLQAWDNAVEIMGDKAANANVELRNTIGLMKDTSDSSASYDFNSQALAGVVEQQKAYEQTRKNASDLATDIQNVTQNTSTAGKTAQTLEAVIANIEFLTRSTGQNANTLVSNLKLGFNTFTQLQASSKAISDYSKENLNATQNKLAVEQRIAEVYKATGSKEKAEKAGRDLEMQQLAQQEQLLKNILATNQGNKSTEKAIQEIQLERLKIQNQGMKADEKIKDRSDKIIGVEERMALLRNRSMTDRQFQMAQLELEVRIEKEKQAYYAGNVKKQVELEQSKQRQVELERQIWEQQQKRELELANNRDDQLARTQRATGSTGQMTNLQQQLQNQQAILNKTKENTAAQEEYRKKILETTTAMAELRIQREREMQSMVGSSLGATYTPTTGLSGEDKNFADMQNKMASYDQAISKMSELNSEATAVGQSLGNLTNSIMQFSKGSLDMTSMVAAGMQSVSSIIQYNSNAQITAIEAAIAAEQKRDGKSEESKAKIKKLEAEKVKIQQDAAKKQIIIQTAVAVMQAATAVPYPWSIPLMIAAGLAGALALSQASNASSLSSVDDSSSTASLTLGERQKNVDVSMSANSGELSYIRGEKGVGNANTFIPRAEGGNMYPGVSYGVGEHGMEVLTPMVPMRATPAEEVSSSSGSSSSRPITMHINAIDAASFEQFALNNSTAFRNAVEMALNESGSSLNRIK